MNRWIVYQRERFPLAAHTPLVAAFSASAVCYSALVRGAASPPPWRSFVAAFVTSLVFFLQLRIADEFKDFDEDARHRPYRPVPRGLVTLAELARIGVAGAILQLAIALWLEPANTWLLGATWIYLALMTREFFGPAWLKRHPVVYMASHMAILPLVDLYATACDWGVAGLRRPPNGLYWFLIVSYLNGIVVEIGRKTRAPADEEPGVETYSVLWGTRGAAGAWIGAVVLTAAAAWRAARQIGTDPQMLVLLVCLVVACGATAAYMASRQRPKSGRAIEAMSAAWTILMYLGLGAAPLAATTWR